MDKCRDRRADDAVIRRRIHKIMRAVRVDTDTSMTMFFDIYDYQNERYMIVEPIAKWVSSYLTMMEFVRATTKEIEHVTELACRFYPDKFDQACDALAFKVLARTLADKLRPVHVRHAIMVGLPEPIAEEICDNLIVHSSR